MLSASGTSPVELTRIRPVPEAPVDNKINPLVPFALIANSSEAEPISNSAWVVPLLWIFKPVLPVVFKVNSPDPKVPVVTIFCEPKSGDIFVPAIAALASICALASPPTTKSKVPSASW